MIVPGKIVDRTSILFAIVTHGKHTNFSQLYMSIFVFGFCRTLVRTKIQQITVRASEHNWACSIFVNFGLAYATINRSGVNFLLSYLSSIHYTSSQFSPTPLFASASNRVRHYRQSTPPPRFGRACKIIWLHCPPTSKWGRYDEDNATHLCQPLHKPLRF